MATQGNPVSLYPSTDLSVQWEQQRWLDFEADPRILETQRHPISRDSYIVVVRMHVGSEYEKCIQVNKSLVPSTVEFTEGRFRVIMAYASRAARIDFTQWLGCKTLVNGRCKCRKWGNWECHGTEYNQDCVDCGAYQNRADDHCDSSCGSYIAYCYTPPTC